jgi:hypothetical protein
VITGDISRTTRRALGETTGLARVIQVSRSVLFEWSLQRDTRYRLWWVWIEIRTSGEQMHVGHASWMHRGAGLLRVP